MGQKLDTPDPEVARIAARQHGVLTRHQLEAVDLGARAIRNRVARGQLHRIHRGVYAVGHQGLSLHGRFMAAVLACGPGAVLSHTSAAVLWELLKPVDGPVTSVARTLEDLRASSLLEPHLLRRATRQAELTGYRLEHLTTDRTRSDLEALFLSICRRYAIPHPEVKVKLGRWTVDFLWRSERVVVETDFWTYHRGSIAFEEDHARDLDLRSAGYTVLRYDDRQLEDEPGRVAEDVARALSGGLVAVG